MQEYFLQCTDPLSFLLLVASTHHDRPSLGEPHRDKNSLSLFTQHATAMVSFVFSTRSLCSLFCVAGRLIVAWPCGLIFYLENLNVEANAWSIDHGHLLSVVIFEPLLPYGMWILHCIRVKKAGNLFNEGRETSIHVHTQGSPPRCGSICFLPQALAM